MSITMRSHLTLSSNIHTVILHSMRMGVSKICRFHWCKTMAVDFDLLHCTIKLNTKNFKSLFNTESGLATICMLKDLFFICSCIV